MCDIVPQKMILYVLASCFITFAQQWHSVEPRVVDQTLFSISFLDSIYGWAVGENGIVLNSTDGGSSWALQQTGVTDTLLDISFGDSLNGMAVGNNSIMLKTEDGGKTWQKLKKRWDTLGYTFNLIQVNYFGKDTCWILNDEWLYLTIDGGKTWHDTGFAYKSVVDVYFKNSQTFWALCGDGASFKTSDGGKSFDSLQKPLFSMDNMREPDIGQIFFINDSTGWIANVSGYLTSTTNGGTSWRQLTLVDTNCYSMFPCFLIKGFHFITPANGVVLAWFPYRILYKTTDNGITWTKDPTFPRASEFLQKLYYDKQENGWVVGEFGSIYTNKKTRQVFAGNGKRPLQRIFCDARFSGNKLIIKNSGDIESVSLFNLSGSAVVLRRPMESHVGQNMTATICLPGLAIGNYICKIYGKNGILFSRIIQKLR